MKKQIVLDKTLKLYESIRNLEIWIPETNNCLIGASKINGQEHMRLEILKLINKFYSELEISQTHRK